MKTQRHQLSLFRFLPSAFILHPFHLSMSPALALFLLRLALAVLLYAFLGGILYLLWLDVRRAMAVAQARDRARGRLVLIACDLPSPHVGEAFPL
ncbi:MAG: hypothetical protein AAB217_16125, partial [Chloroflexota bacterium]